MIAPAAALMTPPPITTRILSWWVRRRVFPGVAVFCYHGVRPDALPDRTMAFEQLHVRRSRFEEQMRALSQACHPISLDDWRRHVRDGTPMPERPVHVTFDDGYRSVLSEALPILERYRIPATILLCTGPIERRERYWYDALALESGDEAAVALKASPHPEWMSRVSRLDRSLATAADPHAPLTRADVTRLAAHPLIEVGGHTHEHPILARADLDVQREEIGRCADAIRQWTGRPMRAFAYPNGRPGIDYTEDASRIVREAGVDHAFSTETGFAPADGDPLSHPRFLMTAGVTAGHLLHRLARVWT